jgi:hypothetical protein
VLQSPGLYIIVPCYPAGFITIAKSWTGTS